MSSAKEYLKQQMQHPEFKQNFLNEKARLDIEYQLEELKRDIAVCKPVNELIGKIDQLERFVQHA
jgi:polyhydroxyalkanoate synthesis regulator phasin